MQDILGKTIFGQKQDPHASVSPYTLGTVRLTTTSPSETSSLNPSSFVSLLCYMMMTHRLVPNHVTLRHPNAPHPRRSPVRIPIGQKAVQSSLARGNLLLSQVLCNSSQHRQLITSGCSGYDSYVIQNDLAQALT